LGYRRACNQQRRKIVASISKVGTFPIWENRRKPPLPHGGFRLVTMMGMVPAPLSHTSARALEYDAMRELLRGYTWSALGQARLQQLAPSADRAWIERQQQLTAEIREYLRTGGRFDFTGMLDPGRLVEKARIQGAALEPREMRDLITVVDRAAEWLEIALHPPSDLHPAPGNERMGDEGSGSPWPAVAALSSAIIDFTPLLRGLRGKILPDGSLDDRASPELAHIRREIERQKRLIQDSLSAYVRRLADVGTAQEELVTIRGERFVIPIKAEQKRRVDGVVHGVSSSGQTVFIEPLETIEQNNDLVKLLEEEQAEIHRILLEMTRRVAELGGAILAAADAMAELELQFAKARFALDYECVPARVSDGGLLLHNARHPLLERNLRARRERVVPVSIELNSYQGQGSSEDAQAACRQLVITGPNTGGKTVTLKTIGLLALMAQSGIPVPAERAELPICDAVLADIGDYQSIEQNLSTFSAHVTNIDRISRTATARSLVLLDELGSATDPEEGAALAVAIADHFRRIGALTVISTHHTSLKVYGANAAGVINAAVGFDERTLQPTFELKIGVPGASAGINIAQRLGLNPEIIAGARARLSSQALDVARFLDRLHGELRAAEAERAAVRAREQELTRERNRLALEGRKEQRERVREMERKLESLLKDFEFHAREAVTAVQDRAAALKLSKDAERRIAKLRREFKEQFNQAVVAHVTGSDRGDDAAQPHLVKNVLVGDTVRVKSLGRPATVMRHFEDDSFEVQAGPMKMRIARDDIAGVLAQAAESPVKAARAKGIQVSLAREDTSAPAEINVIGRNVDEATSEVEKFLDRAFLAGRSRVRIVHGSGMGILRKALRQYLQKHPQVANISEPPQSEGGAGATVVELRT
jgi:DNA mismatch repair protein MutS2